MIPRWSAFVVVLSVLLIAKEAFPDAQAVSADAWGNLALAPALRVGSVPVGVSPRGKACANAAVLNASMPPPPLFAFFLPLGRDPMPVDVAGLRFVGEVAREAVREFALPAKLGRAVTAADVRIFVISREEALRLAADGARAVPEAEKGAPLGALDSFDAAELCEGSCLLLELTDEFSRISALYTRTVPPSISALPRSSPPPSSSSLPPPPASPSTKAFRPPLFPSALAVRATAAALCVEEQSSRFSARLYKEVISAARLPGAPPLALAVPLHQPKFLFAVSLVESCHRLKSATDVNASSLWDLYIVFSEDSTADEFAAMMRNRNPALTSSYTPLVMPSTYLTDQADGVADNFADLKHHYAMAALHPCYETLIVMDADSAVNQPERLVDAARSRLTNRRFFTMRTGMEWWVRDWGTRCVPSADTQATKVLMKDYSLFGWWNDLPSFESRDVPAYLAYINFPRQVCDSLQSKT